MKLFILTGIFYLLGQSTALAQQNRIVGSWDLITRMCMDDGKLIPLEGDTLSIDFQANGTVMAEFIQGQNSEMSYEDFKQEIRDQEEEYLREMIEPHREVCASGGPWDEELERQCRDPQVREALYDRWRSEMEERIAQYIEEDRQRYISRHGLSPEEEERQSCVINFRGSYTVSGDNLTIRGSDTPGPGCGDSGGSETRTLSGWHYFDERGRFYIVLPAYEPGLTP